MQKRWMKPRYLGSYVSGSVGVEVTRPERGAGFEDKPRSAFARLRRDKYLGSYKFLTSSPANFWNHGSGAQENSNDRPRQAKRMARACRA